MRSNDYIPLVVSRNERNIGKHELVYLHVYLVRHGYCVSQNIQLQAERWYYIGPYACVYVNTIINVSSHIGWTRYNARGRKSSERKLANHAHPA